MTVSLGKLSRVDLRTVWQNEASGFTPWLAKPENLAILGETLGIDLEFEAQEKDVGPFRADILCKDADTDTWVLIENQLERTDHTHLGQLLTYSAGLQAAVVVWIASRFTDEHRAALDHLNEITEEGYRFFGAEIELWQIGNSQPAPRFNIVSKPNDWSRAIGRAARRLNDEPVSELKAQQYRYWQALHDLLKSISSPVTARTPRPQHWATFSIGRSGMHLATKVNTQAGQIGAELYLSDGNAKLYFAQLEQQKEAIHEAFGEVLEWEPLPERKGARIARYLVDVDATDESAWPEQHEWLAGMLGRFDAVFRRRVAQLERAEYSEE